MFSFSFQFALFWGICVLISFFGWGWLIHRWLRGTCRDAAHAACLGISAIVSLGGILDFLGLISAPLIRCLVAAGVVVALIALLCLWRSRITGGKEAISP